MTYPVVVVGAGPIGLAAAAGLVERDVDVVVFERGAHAGAAVSEWGHVRLFSKWSMLVAPAAGRLLDERGWTRPADDGYPTGAEWVSQYLAPLADALGDRIRTRVDVAGVARHGRDRVVDDRRETEPLAVHLRHGDGGEELVLARGLIDASGTWSTPNPLGGDGLPAIGEAAAVDAGRVSHRIPDTSALERLAGGHVVLAGSGHSALTVLASLGDIADGDDGTSITWVLRRSSIGDTFGGGDADQLQARGRLGQQAQAVVESGKVRVVTGFRTEAVDPQSDGRMSLISAGGERIDDVDHVVALAGFRPDLTWLSELRLELDTTLQAPVKMAPMIDPNIHSCGSVPPHGVLELAHPEPGVYLAGIKSYGRAPTFLAITGYEQVRSIAADFAGDRAAAENVELVLPDSGLGGSAGSYDGDEPSECCGSPADAELVTLTRE